METKIEKKTAETKMDNLNLNLSIFSKSERGQYNYAKIFLNLAWFVKNKILTEKDADHIKKTGERNFIESKTKFGECSDEKKKIRKSIQNLRGRIEAEKDEAVKKELQRNLDILSNFCF